MSRMKGLIWFVAGIILALLAGFVAYSTLTRVAETPVQPGDAGPVVKIVVANRNIPARTLLTLEDLVEADFPADAVPDGQINGINDAVGKLTLVPIYSGEPVTAQKLVDPNVVGADSRTSVFLNTDQVLMAVPAQDLMSRVGVLKPGDRIDLLYSLPFPENRGIGGAEAADQSEQSTFVLLQNITIVGMTGSIQPVQVETTAPEDVAASTTLRPDALLVTLPPQDALTLKYLIDAGGILDVVLRAPGVERPFETNPVDIDYLINRYSIPTGPGR